MWWCSRSQREAQLSRCPNSVPAKRTNTDGLLAVQFQDQMSRAVSFSLARGIDQQRPHTCTTESTATPKTVADAAGRVEVACGKGSGEEITLAAVLGKA